MARTRPSRPAETSKVSRNPAEAVRRAWETALDAGVYRFATDLVQTTYPALSLSNAGRGPQQNALYLEGQTDMPARSSRMSMQEAGGNVVNSRNGGEARIEGDRRRGAADSRCDRERRDLG
jgi:hypothetical protein